MSRFPLATVLGVRRRQEDAARSDVGRAHVTAARADDEVTAIGRRLDTHAPVDGVHTSAFVAAHAARRSLAAEEAAARVVAAEARARVAEALGTWNETRTRVRLLEQLEERHVERERAEAERAEAAENDDRSAAAWWRGNPAQDRPGATS